MNQVLNPKSASRGRVSRNAEAVTRDYRNGMTYEDIASKYGVTKNAIYQFVKRNGDVRKPRSIPQQEEPKPKIVTTEESRDHEWGAWFTQVRTILGWTAREASGKIGIDPSYVTLIERDGYVPTRKTVERIGKAFGCEQRAMLMAGYIPPGLKQHFLKALVLL